MLLRPPRSTLFPYTTLLPIYLRDEDDDRADAGEDAIRQQRLDRPIRHRPEAVGDRRLAEPADGFLDPAHHRFGQPEDRKSTRLNSSHSQISYAVFCLKKKNNT